MGEPEQQELGSNDGGKRKLDVFELAKQRAQEIASRIANDADLKRPRLVSDSSPDPPSLYSNSIPAPPSYTVSYASQQSQYHGSQGTSKRITIPSGKVGVVIGKGGETIKNIQLQSGAKIQITKDQDADPHSLTRDVELMGTSEQISRAEELINDVIAETDAGGSASSAVHGLNTKQPGAEQFSIRVPNDKVGLLIGKGGETIKYMQSRSGARMQIIPLHLPPGDPTTERTVYINGLTEQIEAAKELVNDVLNGKRIIDPTGSSSYGQPTYPATGNWAQPGQTPMQQPQYGYAQPGNQPTPPAYYGNYTQQPAWDQSNPTTMSQTQQMAGYGYYGQQPQMGSAPLNSSYNQTPPVASSGYGNSYSQQTSNYGQNISSQTPTLEQQRPYATSNYGSAAVSSQSDGAISSQSTQAAPAYPPPAYNQQVADPQTYWTAAGYAGQPPPQTGYDQTGYSQAGYGVSLSSNQPVYGQGGYPLQPSPAAANYAQGTNPLGYGQPQLEAQPQSQPSNNGHSQSLAYGAEIHDGNSNPGHGSNPSVKEAVPSER
ncbi:far upstream element-binding protein 2 [Ricinus communis]|uniref:RNA-binding protein Nova-1, putative n=1 Tax=Ricinus communis TaxID=3988 RepID=B9S767_RICCO|nr:far upstream element-binding protein 2 [Ricinus communis]EEF40472.1 RNA-binding protein Nova-1, putative [Ricinus communis]|eukprot:XP_002521836.1 far upstream element-binding protein 2 [Ricinus communis]